MSEHDVNAYSSPAAIENNAPDIRQIALNRLRIPSIGLMIPAILGVVGGAIASVAFIVQWINITRRYGIPFDDGVSSGQVIIVIFVVFPVATCLNLFHVYGAWCMQRGVRHRVAVSSAIVSCIPYLSPMCVFGIPFGIWALVVLFRSDVRAAFASPLGTKY